MLSKHQAPGGRSRLTTGLLVGTLVLIGLAIALAVVSTVTTSARARKEATEAVLLAKMQAALEQVAEQTDGWMDRRDDDEVIDEFDVWGLAAVSDFATALMNSRRWSMPMSRDCSVRLRRDSKTMCG